MVGVARGRFRGAPGVRRCPWRLHTRRLLPGRRATPVVVLGDRPPRAETGRRAPRAGATAQVPPPPCARPRAAASQDATPRWEPEGAAEIVLPSLVTA